MNIFKRYKNAKRIKENRKVFFLRNAYFFDELRTKHRKYSELQSDAVLDNGEQVHYKVNLDYDNNPDIGLCLAGELETFYKDTLIYAEGFFDILYADGHSRIVPFEDGYAHYYIVKPKEDGDYEFNEILVSGRFRRCKLTSTEEEAPIIVDYYRPLPERYEQMLSTHNALLMKFNPKPQIQSSSNIVSKSEAESDSQSEMI